MTDEVNKELLEKYLRGECSAAEERKVRLFLRTPQSEKLLHEVLSANEELDRDTFDQVSSEHPKNRYWLETINQRISDTPAATRRFRFSNLYRNAAIWTAVLLTSVGALSYFSIPKKETLVFVERYNPDGQRSVITLSDSSVVYLGAGSRLRYPEHFEAAKREITLSGEAFFEVKRNPHKPFTVITGKVRTTVLGTSFKIEAFQSKPLSVQVATGKVKVEDSRAAKALAILLPGQRVTYFHGEATKETVDIADVKGLKDSRIVFRDASLLEISQTLQRWYNVKISFKKAQKSAERMTLTVDANLSVDKVLNVLSSAGKFKYTIKHQEIVIR